MGSIKQKHAGIYWFIITFLILPVINGVTD